MKLRFQNKKFNTDALRMVQHAVQIIDRYRDMGFTLTLRQLYYQFVAGNLFPDDRKYQMQAGKWVRSPKGSINAEPNYKWLGDIIADARMAGIVDWGMEFRDEDIWDRSVRAEEKDSAKIAKAIATIKE